MLRKLRLRQKIGFLTKKGVYYHGTNQIIHFQKQSFADVLQNRCS